MTTKYKIIMGFAVLLLLLGTMAFFGYTSLQTASTNFNDYRRMANVNVDASDLKSAVYETVYYTELFLKNRDPKMLAEAQTRLNNGLKVIGHGLETSRNPENVAALTKSRDLFNAMQTGLRNLQENVTKVHSTFETECLPLMIRTDNTLTTVAEGARGTQNAEALYYLSLVWKNIAAIRENLALFLDNLDPQAGRKTDELLNATHSVIADLAKAMPSQAGVRDHANVEAAFTGFMKTFEPMMNAGGVAVASREEISKHGREILALADALNAKADGEMRAMGEFALASNTTAQVQVLVISLAGVLLGIAFAAFTIVSLVRTLSRMSQFASDIADGNFESQVRITEKGEIGYMFLALKRIPEIFGGVISRCNAIANDISSGLFRDRLDEDDFNGGFKDLARGINTIAAAYTRSIDSLPVAIVTLDAKLQTKFNNTVGAEMLGDDAIKAFGGKMPMLESSIRENKRNSGETSVTSPEGKLVHVAATSLPMRNLDGDVVGGLEVLTDISEIKQKQEIMLQVADQASAISDRVAAASEQLAAQVEQVSRGAEVQRARVESTASAMTEMNSTVMEVARSAAEASDQSEQTKNNAQDGATVVNKVVDAINEVNGIASRLQTNMESLGQQAESIGSVMNVISDIADQTNLLALNAAIEAARAGEAGRGFAVVADEVRKLAEKTMSATKEVGQNITAIQHSAQTNIQEVSVAGKSVGEATTLANESGTALQAIVNLAASTSSVVTSIATAAEEQSAASEEITQAVDEINRLVGETTEGMIQSSSAVQDLSRTAQELRRVMEGLH